MLLRLADHLDMPLEARNALLLAAGFAPLFPQHDLADAELTAAREIIDRILSGHAPHPALAVDRHWTLLSANAAIAVLTDGVAGHLLTGAVNVLRLGLHPEGLAPRIVNFAEWRAHLLRRLARDVALSADPVLAALLEELESYPAPIEADMSPTPEPPEPAVAVPLIITSPLGPLTFLSTTTMFGTATDVTLAGIAIESFFPANRPTPWRPLPAAPWTGPSAAELDQSVGRSRRGPQGGPGRQARSRIMARGTIAYGSKRQERRGSGTRQGPKRQTLPEPGLAGVFELGCGDRI